MKELSNEQITPDILNPFDVVDESFSEEESIKNNQLPLRETRNKIMLSKSGLNASE